MAPTYVCGSFDAGNPGYFYFVDLSFSAPCRRTNTGLLLVDTPNTGLLAVGSYYVDLHTADTPATDTSNFINTDLSSSC
jgi:hypothetical protein